MKLFSCFKRRRNPDQGKIPVPPNVQKPEPKEPPKLEEDSWAVKAYHNSVYETTRFHKELMYIKEEYLKYTSRYLAVEHYTGVPAKVICAIHALECSLSFTKILHNGENLKDVERRGTIYVPKGVGKGKGWSWESAAVDALTREASKFPDKWDIAGTLDFLERFNGLGYRKYHKNVNTPYLWSGTQHYIKGKYTEKRNWLGRIRSYFDNDLVSKQVGCVPILRTLAYEGVDK